MSDTKKVHPLDRTDVTIEPTNRERMEAERRAAEATQEMAKEATTYGVPYAFDPAAEEAASKKNK